VIFRSYFQLSIASFYKKISFSKTKKELPLVAFFHQEKLYFFNKKLSITNEVH